MVSAAGPDSSTRIHRKTQIRIQAGPDEAFPLFTPQGESLWSEDWEPNYRHPPTNLPEQDAVFTTPDGLRGDRIWTVLGYKPSHHRIDYLCVAPEQLHTRIAIRCSSDDEGGTIAEVEYVFTALGPEGEKNIQEMSPESFDRWIRQWERTINEYLRSGGSRT